ncbi:hypothetical protein [Sphingosinicella rhizophila]|nr:hypothetical protein [Sphingosinicella sp. GR2756]
MARSKSPAHWNLNGWTIKNGPCVYGSPACWSDGYTYYSTGGSSATGCLTGQATSPLNCSKPGQGSIPGSANHAVLWEKYDPPGPLAPKKRAVYTLVRPPGVATEPYATPGSAARPYPVYVAPRLPANMPDWLPTYDPHIVPPGRFMPTPEPIPYSMIPRAGPNPRRSPKEQRQRGPAPRARSWSPYRQYPKRPGPGVKERKGALSAGGTALKIVGGFTESLDVINSFYDALPNQYRPGYYELHYRDKKTGEIKTYWKKRWNASQWQRAKAVFQHWDKVDLAQGLANAVAENVKDVAWGTVGRNAGGWQLGPWDSAPGDWSHQSTQKDEDWYDEAY